MSVLKRYVPKRQLSPNLMQEIEGKLKQALNGRVLSAYIFGSVGDGSYTPASDIDLILVKDSNTPFASRGKEFLDLFEIYPDLDILVYTQAELSRQLEHTEPGFWRSVQNTIRQIV